ncbi:uncharacterized protein [Nicotiana tomentosiformis]|uniref:uncharacterized protein n=1 Tax=Nicotiana tomentosiformis TaxID=4098 RepID=UPI00388CE9B7
MRVALLVKNKLGFVDGTYLKGSYRGELATQWQRCNAVVVSWLSSTVASELVPSIMYAFSAKNVWDEFKERFDMDNLTRIYRLWTEIAKSRPYVEHLVRQRLLQFLMGLNESYSQARSNVLQRRPVLLVNQDYVVAVQEESQRALGVVEPNKEPLTMLAGRG